MKTVNVLILCLLATPAGAQLAPPRAPLARSIGPAPVSETVLDKMTSDEITDKMTLSRLVKQVAELRKQVAALTAEQSSTVTTAAATERAVAVLRTEFDTHDHFWEHPQQNGKTTYFTPEVTSVRRKFCKTQLANNPYATADRKVVCSVSASTK